MKSFFSFITDFFFSLRPLNLFLIVLTQTLTCVFLLDNSLCISNLFLSLDFNKTTHFNFYFLVLSTLLSAAGGYILNDIFDRKIDLINAPRRGFFTIKHLYFLSFISFFFLGTSLVLSFLISIKIGLAVFFSITLLIFYAYKSKKIGILKPILVSFLTAFSIILVGFDSLVSTVPIIYFFASWAFLLSMNREIIKDLEDWEGDISQNSLTSVVQLGKKRSILLLNFLSILLIFSIISSLFFYKITLFNSTHKLIMILLISIFIFLLNNNTIYQKKYYYKKLSLFCKIMMLIGILGMIVY